MTYSEARDHGAWLDGTDVGALSDVKPRHQVWQMFSLLRHGEKGLVLTSKGPLGDERSQTSPRFSGTGSTGGWDPSFITPFHDPPYRVLRCIKMYKALTQEAPTRRLRLSGASFLQKKGAEDPMSSTNPHSWTTSEHAGAPWRKHEGPEDPISFGYFLAS